MILLLKIIKPSSPIFIDPGSKAIGSFSSSLILLKPEKMISSSWGLSIISILSYVDIFSFIMHLISKLFIESIFGISHKAIFFSLFILT